MNVRHDIKYDQDRISNLSRELAYKTKFKNLICMHTWGKRNCICWTVIEKIDYMLMINQAFALPSFANNIVDTNGTGDALLAYASLSLAKTKSLFISSIIGSLAAAIECEKDGKI